jgi:hypothetical protein
MKIVWRQTALGTWIAATGGHQALVATEYGNPECRAEVRQFGESPRVTFWPSIEEARTWCERELVRLAGGTPHDHTRNGRGVTHMS